MLRNHSRTFNHSQRKGLTLIELVVVLTILIALAGILVPMLPSMLTRGHDASCATNLPEINKSLQTYYMLYGGYPDQCDALTDGTKMVDYLAGGTLDPLIPGGGTVTTEAGGQLTADTLAANELAAVNAAGIQYVHTMVGTSATGATTTGWDPTFNPYAAAQTAPTLITTSTKLAFFEPASNANAAAIAQHLGLSLTGKYLVLGLGQRCTLVGKGINECPVHFGDTQALNPSFGYERFAILYLVSDPGNPNATPPTPARTISQVQLSGVFMLADDGFEDANDHIQEFYGLGQGNN